MAAIQHGMGAIHISDEWIVRDFQYAPGSVPVLSLPMGGDVAIEVHQAVPDSSLLFQSRVGAW